MKHLLKQKNLKVTPARSTILDVISAQPSPIEPKEIHRLVKDQLNIDLATTYRNLQVLESAQILKVVYFHDNKARYELNHHHHHLVCTKCNSIQVYKDCKLETVKTSLQSIYGFEAKTHSLEFFGLCHSCQ